MKTESCVITKANHDDLEEIFRYSGLHYSYFNFKMNK